MNYDIPYYVNTGIGGISLIFHFMAYLCLKINKENTSNSDASEPTEIRILSDLKERHSFKDDFMTASLQTL